MSTDIYDPYPPIQNKYYKWYMNICVSRQLERGWSSRHTQLTNRLIKHHIVPDSFYIERTRNKQNNDGWLTGNPEDRNNLVFLTDKEHFIVHRLLCKCYEKLAKRKMVYAFKLMCSKNKNSHYYQLSLKIYNQDTTPCPILVCLVCEKEFMKNASRRQSKFCSRICYNIHRNIGERMRLICQICHNNYEVVSSKIKKSKYCSQICQRISRRKT